MNKLDNYYEVRDKIKAGDLISFSNHSSIISRLISLRTHSSHTHSAIVISKISPAGNRLIIAEALEAGPRPGYLSKRVKEYKGSVWWFPLKNTVDKQRRIAEEFVWDKLLDYTRYDYRSIWRQLFSKVSADARELFCSELVQMAFEKAGVIKALKKALNPGELVQLPIFDNGIKLN